MITSRQKIHPKLIGIRNFTEKDNWGNLDKVDINLVKTLDELQNSIRPHSTLYISPKPNAVYYETNSTNVRDIMHKAGLSAIIFISGSFYLTLLEMISSPKIGHINVLFDEYWEEKNLKWAIEFDIRNISKGFSLSFTVNGVTKSVVDNTTAIALFDLLTKGE